MSYAPLHRTHPFWYEGMTLLAIEQKACLTAYYDTILCLRDGVLARGYRRYLKWFYGRKAHAAIMRDAQACMIPEGEIMPWWTLGWWLVLPLRVLRVIAIEVDGRTFREIQQ
jgi:hypothetical protein